MQKVRVLEVFDSLEISGGVQMVIMNVLRNIDREKVQIDFAVYDLPEKDSYKDEAEALGVNIYKIDNVSSHGVFSFYKQLCSFFKTHSYDIVHAHNLFHNGIILRAAKKAGVKKRISHSHQSFDDRNYKFPRNFFTVFFKALNNIEATDRVACSDLAADFLFGKNKPYIFIPNSVDFEKFRIEKPINELRESFGVSDPSVRILAHIGRFAKQKNQPMLIEIMKRLRNKNCVLLVAGQGELREEFLSAVKKEGLQEKIRYLGLIRNIPELLTVSDCLLVPSIYEGLPVVGVEAQAAGCRAMISNHLTKQVDLGLGLVDYLGIDNPDPWVERIKDVLSKPKETVPYETILAHLKEHHFENESNLRIWDELYDIA